MNEAMLPAWYHTYVTVVTWVWVIVTARATYVSFRSISKARKNLEAARSSNGLRMKIGRNHVRREALRFVAYIVAFFIGVGGWTPLPKMFPLLYGLSTMTVLVLIIVILYINTELDYKLRKDLDE